jgi:hypothetical protein
MAIKIRKKPLSNTEKQKRFRARKEADGLVRRDAWTDRAGFLAKPDKNGGWNTITLTEFERHVEQLLSKLKNWEKDIVYAEILEYTKQVMPKFRRIFETQRQIEQEELNHGYR